VVIILENLILYLTPLITKNIWPRNLLTETHHTKIIISHLICQTAVYPFNISI